MRIFCFLIICLLGINCGFAITEPTTERAITATEIFGPETGKLALTIGNGGAGPTCLLQALSEDFIQKENLPIQIAWIQGITRLTLENLKEQIIDISLTYEAPLEQTALEEGWASNRHLVFNDHFLIVGPRDNPAGLTPQDSPEEAFQKIAAHGQFFSRNDRSGNNERELSIWHALHINPEFASWYIKKQVFPMDALMAADEQGLYTLTDRGTLLAIHKKLNHTAVYVQNGDRLMNRCHGMLQDKPSEIAKLFMEYLISERAQNLVAHYAGKNQEDESEHCPLFTPAQYDNFLGPDCLKRLGLTPY